MTSYNGQPCVYDATGNPTTYRGNVLSWSHVRQLDSFNGNTFAYGADGVRCRKNNTVYTVNGGKLLQETNGSQTLTYYHSGSGIVGFGFNGTDHFFRKNLQGDVTAIYRADGTLEAEYTYDAWGKVLSVVNHTADNIGDRNPIRYRGYYYDSETKLYYLQSRYYDPETGRFISSDTTEVLDNAMDNVGGLNLFTYCRNNPVRRKDTAGTTDIEVVDMDGDPGIEEDKIIGGGNTGTTTGNASGNSGGGNSGGSGGVYISSSGDVTVGNPKGENTEKHHIVEKCQNKKSGFSMTDIQGNSNLVDLPYSLHRKISGFYSSKPAELGGLRVRDWLAGQSFEKQFEYGIKVIEQFWEALYGE